MLLQLFSKRFNFCNMLLCDYFADALKSGYGQPGSLFAGIIFKELQCL